VTDAERLPVMFRHFAEQELDGYSARYAQLARFLTDRPALARPLLAAPRSQQRAILLFAAVQYLLRTSAAGHPLAGYLPVLGGARPAGEGLTAAFTDLVATHRAELAELCATRLIQTNEATRAALLRPGLGRAAELVDGCPLTLVELGTSAGLLLLPDRYAYHYATPDGSRTQRTGRDEAPSPLVLGCEVRGRGWPEPATVPIDVAARTGVDVAPVDTADSDAVTWLRSCVWPEHVDRLETRSTTSPTKRRGTWSTCSPRTGQRATWWSCSTRRPGSGRAGAGTAAGRGGSAGRARRGLLTLVAW